MIETFPSNGYSHLLNKETLSLHQKSNIVGMKKVLKGL